jgi:hypothetical protein
MAPLYSYAFPHWALFRTYFRQYWLYCVTQLQLIVAELIPANFNLYHISSLEAMHVMRLQASFI